MKKRAVVLVSGGLDSATCLAIATHSEFDCYALTFDYGQRQQTELDAAKRVIHVYNVKQHKIIELNLSQIGGSALTDHTMAVPDYTGDKSIPITYVPARNTIFLSIALSWAEVLEARDVFIGVSAVDYSGYPDCRPEYINAFQRMANLATKASVTGNTTTIHTPLIHLNKAETIQRGLSLGLDYSLTVTCYQANENGEACGRCDSCTLRLKGFAKLGIPDPALYI